MIDSLLNYLQYLPVLAMVLYVFLLIRKVFRKEWLNRKLLFTIKIVVLIPFWAAYVYYIIPFAVPEIKNTYNPPDTYQKLIIESNEDLPSKYLLLGRIWQTNTWRPIYQKTIGINFTPIVEVKSRDLRTIEFRSGSKDFDIIAISKKMGKSYKKDEYKGIAFNLPKLPIKIYSAQFEQGTELEKPIVDVNKELMLLIITLTAFFGIIYHSLSTRGNLWFAIPIYSIYSLFGIVSLYLSINLSLTLWYFLL